MSAFLTLIISSLVSLLFFSVAQSHRDDVLSVSISLYGVNPEMELAFVQTLHDTTCENPTMHRNRHRINQTCVDIALEGVNTTDRIVYYLKCDDSDNTLILLHTEGHIHPNMYGISQTKDGGCKEIVTLEIGTLVCKNNLYKTNDALRLVRRRFLYPHTNVSIFTVLGYTQHEYAVWNFDDVLPKYMKIAGFRVI